MADIVPIAQQLRFFVDFSGLDARARTLPKDLIRLHISGRPSAYSGSALVGIWWAGDDVSRGFAPASVLVYATHRPEDSMYRHHTLDIGTAALNPTNTGRLFHFIVSGQSPFILEAMDIEAVVREADFPTSYQGVV